MDSSPDLVPESPEPVPDPSIGSSAGSWGGPSPRRSPASADDDPSGSARAGVRDHGPRVAAAPRSSRRTFVSVQGPGDLVAAVPYLVGFDPVRSVVVVSLRGARLRCGLVARVDVPSPEDASAWADGLVAFVLDDGPREVVVIVYHERPWRTARRPFGPLVDTLERRFAAAGVGMKDALYVTDDRFWSYTCADPRCCPSAGTPLEIGRSSPLAVSYVAEGRAPLADRDAVVARLAPGPPDLLAATREAAYRALDLALRRQHRDVDGHWQMWQIGTAELFSSLVRRRLDGDTDEPAPAELGRVAAGLLDRTTRDLVALRSTGWLRAMPGASRRGGSGELEDMPDDPGTNIAELRRLSRGCAAPEDPRCRTPEGQQEVAHVLAALCRSCDAELAVSPLVLAGMQAWASGEGVLAWTAVDRALAIDPGCRMALLLSQLMRSGIAPAWVQQDREEDEAVPPRAPG